MRRSIGNKASRYDGPFVIKEMIKPEVAQLDGLP